MRPTPFLERCPQLVNALGNLGVTLGRTRLMRLSGHAEVTPHIDTIYYWMERMRVHIVTVNDYLARRDAEWMGRIYGFLGLSVGVNVPGMQRDEKQAAYGADLYMAWDSVLAVLPIKFSQP